MKKKIDVRKLKWLYRLRRVHSFGRGGSVERVKVIGQTAHSLILNCTWQVGYKFRNRIGIRWLQSHIDEGHAGANGFFVTEDAAYERLLERFLGDEKYHRVAASANKKYAAHTRSRLASIKRRRKSR